MQIAIVLDEDKLPMLRKNKKIEDSFCFFGISAETYKQIENVFYQRIHSQKMLIGISSIKNGEISENNISLIKDMLITSKDKILVIAEAINNVLLTIPSSKIPLLEKLVDNTELLEEYIIKYSENIDNSDYITLGFVACEDLVFKSAHSFKDEKIEKINF